MSSDRSEPTQILTEQSAADHARLVAAIAGGDREAEHAFVERYQPRVRAMLLARTRNADVTADLVQDVIIESICALRKGQLREAAKLTPFVLGIARNVLNSHFRGAARQAADSIELPDELPDLRSSASQVEDEQRESMAMKAIASLELIDRSILQMTLVDGLKPGAIAEKLRLNPDVVRQRKLRATRKVMDFVRGQSQKEASVYFVSGPKR